MPFDNTTQANIDKWLTGAYDAETKKTIQTWLDNQAHTELVDSFYKDLEFGTGGLRGIMGVGSNRFNRYTVGAATQGLANYLLKKYPQQEIKVVVSYDSRNNSRYFAQITADVFSANGIYVYFFNSLRPTPLLSFSIRELACQSGVMITASHNPKEYNGYKAYRADGGQFTSPDDKMVMQEVVAIEDIQSIKFDANSAYIKALGEEIDEIYLEKIKALSVSPEAIQAKSDLKIVYSPIHGTGITLVPKALKKYGFKNVHIVEEQQEPNGNFPTVIYPNPEEYEALTLALAKAQKIDADLVLATDPDADRVGIAVKDLSGKFVLLNGNQTGSLIIHYMLLAWKANQKLTGKEYVVSTVVTTGLIQKMCADFGVDYVNTLTGFKWIGQVMTQREKEMIFIAGGEESYGYLIGDLVRDKDAVVSCAIIAEMAAYYKQQGWTLYQAMIQMYKQYGLYKEELVSITKQGKAGAEEIKAMMQAFRLNPPAVLGGSKVIGLKDYEQNSILDVSSGKRTELGFPKSDVLQFITADGSIISARPSGTEPKIKFYCSVREDLNRTEDFDQINQKLTQKIQQIMQELVP